MNIFCQMRNYKRKTDRKPVTEDILQAAKSRRAEGISIRTISNEFGIEESTLRKRLKAVTSFVISNNSTPLTVIFF